MLDVERTVDEAAGAGIRYAESGPNTTLRSVAPAGRPRGHADDEFHKRDRGIDNWVE